MTKYQITISIPDECPTGTAWLFALAEMIKDVPSIVNISAKKPLVIFADMDEGDVEINVSLIKSDA